jgi:two-component system LytT family response regulator/two-component system response regulator LytT
MNILIVDDEKPARGELSYMLKQLESTATIFEARNGQEALHCVANHLVDVAFLDINMPGMSGLTLASALVERPAPPLMIFATTYDAHAVRAFELAALGYLVNLNHIAEVVPWFSGAYLLRMDDPARSEIPLSRQYAKDLSG